MDAIIKALKYKSCFKNIYLTIRVIVTPISIFNIIYLIVFRLDELKQELKETEKHEKNF